MRLFNLKTFLILFLLSLFPFSMAQSEGDIKLKSKPVEASDMDVLQLYYPDKDLVVTSTRAPKSLAQIAENMTIITAKEIEDMNAHNLAEVLDRVTGIFVSMYSREFGAVSFNQIQGAEERHTLVLLDGIPWNKLADNAAETNSIPVAIIDRIEIIKGPASSVWGSSLGGVINVITKPAGETEKPTTIFSASYGEGNRQDYRAETSSRTGKLWYYLYAGRQYADNLMDSRFFENNNAYAKFKIPFSQDVSANFTMGTTNIPKIGLGDQPDFDLKTDSDWHIYFGTASLDAQLTKDLNMNLSLNYMKRKIDTVYTTLGFNVYKEGTSKELFLDQYSDDTRSQEKIKFAWKKANHTIVAGGDFEQGKIDKTVIYGRYYRSTGQPAKADAASDYDEIGIFINDTVEMGKFTLTPGLRYNYNDIGGDFLSPSLGATYQPRKDTVFRVSASKGFSIPGLSYTKLPGTSLDPNPDLDPETVWSYQGGFETRILPYLWIKSSVFYDEVSDTLYRKKKIVNKVVTSKYYNQEDISRRNGFEFEVETDPFHNFSLLLGTSYVRFGTITTYGSTENYTYNGCLKYDDKKSFNAQLSAHYISWDYAEIQFPSARFDDFIFDLSLTKKVYKNRLFDTELFFNVNNLFDILQYRDLKNPLRWVEGGVRIKI
ncbi:MAG: TonB-dependent receptor [Desulfobacterales bacterium]|nr:TonB-dependent receptor [Desulfobacterales bacterium]